MWAPLLCVHAGERAGAESARIPTGCESFGEPDRGWRGAERRAASPPAKLLASLRDACFVAPPGSGIDVGFCSPTIRPKNRFYSIALAARPSMNEIRGGPDPWATAWVVGSPASPEHVVRAGHGPLQAASRERSVWALSILSCTIPAMASIAFRAAQMPAP